MLTASDDVNILCAQKWVSVKTNFCYRKWNMSKRKIFLYLFLFIRKCFYFYLLSIMSYRPRNEQRVKLNAFIKKNNLFQNNKPDRIFDVEIRMLMSLLKRMIGKIMFTASDDVNILCAQKYVLVKTNFCYREWNINKWKIFLYLFLFIRKSVYFYLLSIMSYRPRNEQ
jgi:hypothetical protein